MCGAKPPLGGLEVYSHRKYFKILRLLLVTSGAPDRLATIARVESIIHVDWCCTIQAQGIQGVLQLQLE